MREPIKYFIEPDWNGKTNSLYLARLEGSVLYTIARFRNPLMAEMFAKDWHYPLSDKVIEIIEKYKQGERNNGMKKTTVQYFCDKCKEEIKDEPNMNHVVDERFLFGGDCWVSCVDVSFMFRQYGDSIPNENILCDRCKIEALEEVLKKLKERSKRNG